MEHDFLNELVDDDGSEHLWHGYPYECFAFGSFVDSLVALVLYGGWGVQAPVTVVRMALVVDFVSEQQSDAESSLRRGWNGTWEFPMGTANTVHRRVRKSAQNARISRHLSLIGTQMTPQDFDHAVVNRLIDLKESKSGRICRRFPNTGSPMSSRFSPLGPSSRKSICSRDGRRATM
jgi:hypothetical protein